ncbi:MAG: class I SAM-dependent methyltransferase [Candidatus Eremiobacteraeota bacterium]|nr:class I SAM-dependent methyltransferase [Candidatus Eremiobacteraeota bacterium]
MDHRSYFDHMASRWDEQASHDPLRLALIAEALELFPGARVLDAGCGTGVFTDFMVRAFDGALDVVCADFSGKMLEEAEKKLSSRSGVSFCRADLTTDTVPGRAFDRIICYSCFPHFADKRRALANLRRHITPGGFLLIAHSESCSSINELHSRLEGPVRHDMLPGPDEMRKMLQELRFSKVAITDKPHLYLVKASPA